MNALQGFGSIERKEKGIRPNVRLDEQDISLLEEFITSKTLMDRVGSRHDEVNHCLLERLLDKFVGIMWSAKKRPLNPHIRTTNEEGYLNDSAVYQVQSSFNLSEYEGEDDPKTALYHALTEPETPHPLDHDRAILLIRKEIIFTPALKVRGVTDLTQGHFEKNLWVEATPEEKSAGAKLLKFLEAKPDKNGNITIPALTRAELNVMLIRQFRMKVKDAKGFFKNAFRYVDTLGQLKRVFNVLKPTNFLSNISFGVTANDRARKERIMEYVNDLVG